MKAEVSETAAAEQNGWHARVLRTIIYKPVADCTHAWQADARSAFDPLLPLDCARARPDSLNPTNQPSITALPSLLLPFLRVSRMARID
jgi:hypothetical protein